MNSMADETSGGGGRGGASKLSRSVWSRLVGGSCPPPVLRRVASPAGSVAAAGVRGGGGGRGDALAESRAGRGGGGGGGLGQRRNIDVHLTCGPAAGCVPTRCLYDRAHAVRDHAGLVPAAMQMGRGRVIDLVPSARPRMYPEHQMTSRGVAYDSAYDATYTLARRLEGVPGLGASQLISPSIAASRWLARYRWRPL